MTEDPGEGTERNASEAQDDPSGRPPPGPQDPAGAQPPGPQDPAQAAEEEEMRRRFEEEIRKLRIEDVLLQSVVSLINLTSRRIAKPDEQDLDQARLGIDAIRALVDHLPSEPASQVRQALSELQVAYASEAGGGAAPGGAPGGAEGEPEGGGGGAAGPGAAPKQDESSGLWTPHDRSS
jgi:hypothetical protein